MCRKLANVGKFEAWLPYGPQRADHYFTAPDLDAQEADPGGAVIEAWKQYASTIAAVEQALIEIKGLDEKAAAKHTGRDAGPSYKMTNVAGHKANSGGG